MHFHAHYLRQVHASLYCMHIVSSMRNSERVFLRRAIVRDCLCIFPRIWLCWDFHRSYLSISIVMSVTPAMPMYVEDEETWKRKGAEQLNIIPKIIHIQITACAPVAVRIWLQVLEFSHFHMDMSPFCFFYCLFCVVIALVSRFII